MQYDLVLFSHNLIKEIFKENLFAIDRHLIVRIASDKNDHIHAPFSSIQQNMTIKSVDQLDSVN